MTSKHTPGPWTNSTPSDPRAAISVIAPDGLTLAHALWQGSADEAEANARLIAAAPDMLRTLKRLVEWEQHMGGWEAPVWEEVSAAIRKAEGEET